MEWDQRAPIAFSATWKNYMADHLTPSVQVVGIPVGIPRENRNPAKPNCFETSYEAPTACPVAHSVCPQLAGDGHAVASPTVFDQPRTISRKMVLDAISGCNYTTCPWKVPWLGWMSSLSGYYLLMRAQSHIAIAARLPHRRRAAHSPRQAKHGHSPSRRIPVQRCSNLTRLDSTSRFRISPIPWMVPPSRSHLPLSGSGAPRLAVGGWFASTVPPLALTDFRLAALVPRCTVELLPHRLCYRERSPRMSSPFSRARLCFTYSQILPCRPPPSRNPRLWWLLPQRFCFCYWVGSVCTCAVRCSAGVP